MALPNELRETAERYRQIARGFTDQRTIRALKELAEEYEAAAAQIEGLPGKTAP